MTFGKSAALIVLVMMMSAGCSTPRDSVSMDDSQTTAPPEGDNQTLAPADDSLIEPSLSPAPVSSGNYVVATSDASPGQKRLAQTTLSGLSDATELQFIIDSLAPYQGLHVVGKTLGLGSGNLTIGREKATNIEIDADVLYSGTGKAVNLVRPPNPSTWTPAEFKFKRILATGEAVNSETAVGLYVRGWNWSTIQGTVENFGAGTCVELNSDLKSSVHSWGISFPLLFARGCYRGLVFSGDGDQHFYRFGQYWWSPYSNNETSWGIYDAMSPSARNGLDGAVFDSVWLEPSGLKEPKGIYLGNQSTGIVILQLVWDGSSSSVIIDSVNPIIILNKMLSSGKPTLPQQIKMPPAYPRFQ